MQVLTGDLQAEYPGIVIYGAGDAAHRLGVSDHNDDDTPGIRTPQTDADSVPEHRAIDAMVGPRFTAAAAHAFVAALLASSRSRLSLVIFAGFEYSRRTGFAKVRRTVDPHDDHVHVSGLAADDDNTAHWPTGGTVTTPCLISGIHDPEWNNPPNGDGEPRTLGAIIWQGYDRDTTQFDEYAERFPNSANAAIKRLGAAVARLEARGDADAVADAIVTALQPRIDAAVASALEAAIARVRLDGRVTLEA